MPHVFTAESWLSLAILALLIGIKGFALVNACLWSPEAYDAAGKLTKPAWLALLGLALVLQLPLLTMPFMGILNLAGTVAAVVYLVDVRPAVASVSRGRR